MIRTLNCVTNFCRKWDVVSQKGSRLPNEKLLNLWINNLIARFVTTRNLVMLKCKFIVYSV